MMKVYSYKNCSTCQKALKFLDEKGAKYEVLPIVDTPPSKTELREMLKHLKAGGLSFTKLFNTSGEQYRALKIGDKIKAGMTEAEAIDLLAKNGKLIKRPFVLTAKAGFVGFKPEEWRSVL